MLQLPDIIGLIPTNLKQKALDTVVDFLSSEAKKYVGQELANKIKKLRSDAAFTKAFETGLQKAVNRFVTEYEIEDEDLIGAISVDKEFFKNEQIQNALVKILKQPGAYLADEHEIVMQSFDSVLPTRKNRKRVDRAITYLLKCLAEELWHLPEIQPIYSLQFQRITAESVQQQVELQKMQLQALTGLNSSLRESLLVLANAITEQKALPGGNNPYVLPERPKIYHNLPQPDYGKFVGREVELQKIVQILRPYPHSQEHLVTIDGIGGIGKSALVLEIAHRYLRNSDDFPSEERFEAIIWTSAKRVILTPEGISTRYQILRTLDDIYTAIAVALQREDIIRIRDENIDEVVRNALTCQRTLLIVDNLETVDDEAVMNFLRELPAPTKAIVTTRHRLNVAYPIRLVGMSWNEAQILIKQECEKRGVTFLNNDKIRLLYDRTGGVPLAIVWSIAQMGSGYGINTILNRLGQPTSDIARFCFEGAIEQIQNKPSHKLLMILSLCATDASREALGYAATLSVLDRDDGLVELEKLSLVNKNGDRFSLLPLTKQFALAELYKTPDKDILQGKWVEYFRTLSKEYCKLHYNWTNYDWLLSEGDNILAIIDWAITNNYEEIALSLTRAAQRYLNITGSRKIVDYAKQLLSIAQSLHDKPIYAWICINWLSWLYVEQGKTSEAEALIRQSLSIYEELEDNKGICLAKNYLGDLLRQLGHYPEAEKELGQAMSLANEYGYDDEIASIHFRWGKLTSDRGEWETSKTHWESVIEWYEKVQDKADQDILFLMGAYGHLGWVEFQLDNYQRAKELIGSSLTVFEHMGGKGHTAKLHRQLASIEISLGNRGNALKHLQETLFWAERLGMKNELEQAKKILEELEELKG